MLVFLVLLSRLGELYTQLVRYERYWYKVNQKPIAGNEIVYVAFGDSTAQAVGASNPEKGYVGLIAAEIAQKRGKPVHIVNLGKSGATISDVLETQLPKYEELRVPNKKIITMEIGANDIKDFEAARFEREMDELMNRLPRNTVISDLPSFKGGRLANLESKVEEANRIMYKLAAKHGFELARLHDRIDKNHGLRTFAADIFHPSDYSYKTNWTPAFLERLQSDSPVM